MEIGPQVPCDKTVIQEEVKIQYLTIIENQYI